MSMEKSPKIPKNYTCEYCHYNTCNKKDYVKHTFTAKHQNQSKSIDLAIKIPKNPQNSQIKIYKCQNCDKEYKDNSGLWRHLKKCTTDNTQLVLSESTELDDLSEHTNNTDLITYLMNENKELKNMIMDVCKNNSNTNITNSNNNNNVNSHNKTFNMNVFLNEHCKDAMNISEFVDSIQLGFNDLVNVGKVGYVEGISSIIINKLRSLDIHKRPMHCGDEKRHSMYIKEDGKWEKQPEDNNRVRRLIKQVAFKNTKNTVLFKEKYPDCGTSASKYSDQYNKIVMESFGGRGATDEEKENKIVRMIAREVYIDKTL
jgi:hypothetical protein